MYSRRLALVAACVVLAVPDVGGAQPLMPDFSPVPMDHAQHDMHQHGAAMDGSDLTGSFCTKRFDRN